MFPLPEWIVAALGLPNQCTDLYEALLRLIRNAFTWPSEGPITIINNNGELEIVIDPSFIQAGPGITVVQNPDGSFTISAIGGPGGTVIGNTATILVTGTGTALDPYLLNFAPTALIGAGSTTVTQNPDGSFTIDTTLTPTSVADSASIDHTGTGTALDPYIFSLTAGALTGTGGTTVVQNPDGTFTINSSANPTSVIATPTIDFTGTGTAIDPYAFRLALGAIVAGAGISVSQAPNGVYTITNTGANPVLADSDTIDVTGSGTAIDPYVFDLAAASLLAGAGISVTQDPVTKAFTITNTGTNPIFGNTATNNITGSGTAIDPYVVTFAPTALVAGAGISVVQNPNGSFTITSTATAPVLADTPTIDVEGSGTLIDPYTFAFAANSILAGAGIAVVQNPDGTFTISSTVSSPVLGDTAAIDVTGTGTAIDPYLFNLTPAALVGTGGTTVVQNPDGTFTIDSAVVPAPIVLADTTTIDVEGSGTVVDPYTFSLTPTALVGTGGTTVTQNPDGTFTIDSPLLPAPLIFNDSPTIDVEGDGSALTPYTFAFTAGALLAGAGISVTQDPITKAFTIINTGTSPILQDTATIDVVGDGSVLTPYEFNLAATALLAGAGISLVQNPDGSFTITNTGTSPILSDSASIDVSGDGSIATPYVFELTPGALIAGPGISVVQNPDTTFTITNTSPLSALTLADTPTIDVGGTGVVGDPYTFRFAVGSILAGAGGITVSQAPNGVYTIGTTATTLLFWTEAYNATQAITRWNAVNNSIAAFSNIRGFTINRILTGTIAANALGTDAVDLQQSTTLANTASGANSAIIAGTNNRIAATGARSAVLTGDLNVITGAGCVVVCGNSHNIAGALTAVLAGSLNNTPTGSSNSAILCGTQNTYALQNNTWGSCLMGGEANTLGNTNITSSILAGSQNNIAVSTASSILGGTSNGVGNSTASSLVAGTGGVVSLSTASALVCGNSGFVNQGINSAILAGNDCQVAGSNSVVLAGSTLNFLTTGSSRSLLAVGSNNRFSVNTTDSAIIAGMNCNTTTTNIGRICIVTGNGNTMNGGGTIGDCAILAGTTNQVLANLPADNVFSSSILSGVSVSMTISNTHNFALARIDPTLSKKMAALATQTHNNLVGSCAGGSHVTMGASHSFAMGNEVHVTSTSQGSLTSGSYLVNNKAHSTLLGYHGSSSLLHDEVFGVCNGTYNDPRTLASVVRDDKGAGVFSTDTVMTSGGTTSYLFPKSSLLTETLKGGDDVGYFVSLNNKGEVVPCDDPSRAIGVTVPRAGIILNSQDSHWQGKYVVDDFGRPAMRTSYVDSFLDLLATLLPEDVESLEEPTLPSFSAKMEVLPRDEYLKKELEHKTALRTLKMAYQEKNNAHRASVLAAKQQARDDLHVALRSNDSPQLIEWAISTFSHIWPELKQLQDMKLKPRQVPVISPAYDASLLYVPRIQRTEEWVPVAQKGVVRVRCDGSCLVGDLCHVTEGRASLSTNGAGWRVLSRISPSVVTIML